MVGEQYSPEQRTFMATEYARLRGHRDFMGTIIQIFQQRFPGAPVPRRETIIRQYVKLSRSSTLHNLNSKASPGQTHSGRPRTAQTAANVAAVRALTAHDAAKDLERAHSPVSTARQNVLGIAKSTWSRICKSEKLNCYKMVRSQKLLPGDYQRRLDMCRFFLTLNAGNINNFCFSDEATFCLDGTVNSQNVRRYAPRKGSVAAGMAQGRPGHFRHQNSTFSPKVMVFLGLRGNGTFFGYTLLAGNMNGAAYHNLLQRRALPDLRAGNGGNLNGLTWQQDGAPPHATNHNLAYLGRQFGGRLVARRSEPFGGRDWAARSPDLNPLDFGIWGILKSRLHSPRAQTMLELRLRLDQEVGRLGQDQALLRRTALSILGRARSVVNNHGGYFED